VSCKRIEKLWQMYASGELSGPKQRRFEKHLEGCADCRARREAFDRSIELTMREMPAPAELTPIEWNRIRPDTRTPVRRGRRPLAAALAAAACAALVGAVLYLAPGEVRDRPDRRPTTPMGAGALTERDRYEIRMATPDPGVKIVWVFDRNLEL
jgi:anti-sigma factor RsiW